MPDLSIIIVNYNTYELTSACIHSIIKLKHSVSFEIILIDNGSSELKSQLFKESFPDILFIKSNVNLGFSKAINKGLEVASGATILLLNSDTIVQQNAIDQCYRFLNQNNEYGIATCRLNYADGTVQHNCQKFPAIQYEIILLFRLHKWLLKKQADRLLLGSFFDFNRRIDPDWVWGTFFMFRKEILGNSKSLDDRYFMYAEDMLWCYQAGKANFKVAFLPDVSVIHLMGKSSNGDNAEIKKAHEMHFIKTNYNLLHATLLIICKAMNYATLSIRDAKYLQLMKDTLKLFLTPTTKLILQQDKL